MYTNQLAKIPSRKKSRKIFPVLIFFFVFFLLSIIFDAYLNFELNTIRKKQQEEHEEIMIELEQATLKIKKSVEEISKESPQTITTKQDAQTSDRDCSLDAQTYQDRYMKTFNVNDFICLDKALKREMGVR